MSSVRKWIIYRETRCSDDPYSFLASLLIWESLSMHYHMTQNLAVVVTTV